MIIIIIIKKYELKKPKDYSQYINIGILIISVLICIKFAIQYFKDIVTNKRSWMVLTVVNFKFYFILFFLFYSICTYINISTIILFYFILFYFILFYFILFLFYFIFINTLLFYTI